MLTSITSLPGVQGVALFDENQECVAHALSPPYEPLLLAEAAERIVDAQDSFAGAGIASPDFVAAAFEGGAAVVVTDGEYRIVVLCTGETNLSMLRVATRVLALKARKGKASGDSRSSSYQSTDGSRPGFPSEHHPSVYEPPVSGHPQRSSPRPESVNAPRVQLSWTERSNAPSGSVGVKVMQHVLRALKRQLGEAAQSTLETELLRMKATPRSLSVGQFADLIRSVASKVPDPEGRREFVAEALGDRRR